MSRARGFYPGRCRAIADNVALNLKVPWNFSTTGGWYEGTVVTERFNKNRGSEMTRMVAFLRDESGATAIEYGLIAAGISVAIIAVVNGLGTSLNDKFDSVKTQLR